MNNCSKANKATLSRSKRIGELPCQRYRAVAGGFGRELSRKARIWTRGNQFESFGKSIGENHVGKGTVSGIKHIDCEVEFLVFSR